jgi:FKBP-type peptidyl-prolyl cis-trans isomerase FklB
MEENKGRNFFMKHILTATILAGTMFTANAFAVDSTAKTAAQPAATVNLSTEEDKLSYVLGLNIGANFRAQQVQINPAVLAKGVSDAVTGTAPAMTPGQMQEVIGKFQKAMVEKRTAELKALAEKNAKEGEAFMKENAKKPGVQTLGEKDKEIQYKVITAGKGALAKETDTATLTYTGKLINGQVFDSTEKNGGKPIDLAISNMIPGMKIALMKMPVGSTWEIVIPANLAYGVMGIPNSPIGPNATLVFDLTLTALKPGIASAAPKAKTA